MDKNTVYGLLLIGAILIGFSIYNSPSKKDIELQKRYRDSIAAVTKINQKEAAQQAIANEIIAQSTINIDTIASDSLQKARLFQKYGSFYASSQGSLENYVLENDLMTINISNKGGRISSVVLKKYKAYDSLPLTIGDIDSSNFSFTFNNQNKTFHTSDFFFKASQNALTVNGDSSKSFALRMAISESQYIEYVYTLPKNSYMFDFKVNMVGLADVVSNKDKLTLNWSEKGLSTEKYKDGETNSSTIYYQLNEGSETDYLSEMSDKEESIDKKVNWVGFKKQYFTSVLVSKQGFIKSYLETKGLKSSKKYTKQFKANLDLAYNGSNSQSYDFSFYIGPNHFQTLKAFDLGFEKQIPLGWGIMGWINKFAVIPVFNFLDSFNWSYGIIILVLTILIKVVLLPLTYKAYLSTAKMKVLKPEMDEINTKFANEDPMKKQQAVMELYRKAGVNPLGGCLPMLLQMPILFAMFRFFPASIELRQKSFLWADDLSTYDSIYDLPFNIPFYGDHISLFTLLMTISTLIYTRMNSSQFSGNTQMESMKWVMYLMPIIFLGVFNNYSAGLSYYYFLANMLTFTQQALIKRFVNEEEIHRKIQENKKKPNAGKSKFQMRLEEIAKQAQERQEQLNKGKKK
ncbi:MAG: membrane protein insertase YidC [Bacteroidia bacterium]|nr:membrane protein insertase YidC [Bacteroidia bacterium]MCZ2248877.1 membrane protein insertase YidC [Bacteroidia bacterium]